MPILKYWDSSIGDWMPVGSPDLGSADFVPLSGGTISGSLVVKSGGPLEAQAIVNGVVQTKRLAAIGGKAFDGNIGFTRRHDITLADLRGKKTGYPTEANSLVTKGYVDAVMFPRPAKIEPPLYPGWEPYGNPFPTPGYRRSIVGDFVVLEGVLRTTMTVDPGSTVQGKLFQLDPGHRPMKQVVLPVIGYNGLYTLHVYPNGELQLYEGTSLSRGQWVSLDGCRFTVS